MKIRIPYQKQLKIIIKKLKLNKKRYNDDTYI